MRPARRRRNPVRMGKPVIQPQAASTPAPLSGAASGNVENRVVSFRSRTRPLSISSSSAPRRAAVQTATPNRAPFKAAASASSVGEGNLGLRDGTAFDARAQRGKIGGERRAERRLRRPRYRRQSPECRVGLRRQPDNAPRDVHAVRPRRRPQQPLVQGRPGFRQAVADEQHDVGAHARFARRRQHDAGFAQAIEIAHQRRRMHVIDDAADPLGERDGRPRPLDIRAQSRDERLTASRQKLSRRGGRVFERRRRAVDPCCGVGADFISRCVIGALPISIRNVISITPSRNSRSRRRMASSRAACVRSPSRCERAAATLRSAAFPPVAPAPAVATVQRHSTSAL